MQNQKRPGHPEAPPSQGPSTPVGLGLPQSARLLKRPQFLECYSHGKRVTSPGFLMFVVPRDGKGRLGVAVSKKIGRACQRNRLKRLIREAYRRHRNLFTGWDVVIVPKRGIDCTRIHQFLVDEELVLLATRAKDRRSCRSHHM
ncbi:MAG: ribonuclease P protein component [Deltaproteobacteria bacterium]|nr:ribonuclease P protein component [Deltaproteobacteria bacterium]